MKVLYFPIYIYIVRVNYVPVVCAMKVLYLFMVRINRVPVVGAMNVLHL